MSFSENFINIMNAIGDKVGIAIDWTNKNVMPYMEKLSGRIVNYEMFTSIAWLVFAVVVLIVGIILLVKGFKYKNNPERPCYDDSYIPSILIGIVAVVTFVVMSIVQVGDIITCLTLPEKTIISFIMQYK